MTARGDRRPALFFLTGCPRPGGLVGWLGVLRGPSRRLAEERYSSSAPAPGGGSSAQAKSVVAPPTRRNRKPNDCGSCDNLATAHSLPPRGTCSSSLEPNWGSSMHTTSTS